MALSKSQAPILGVTLSYLAVFTYYFLMRDNFEFMIYVGVVLSFLVLIVYTNTKVNYPNSLLWALSMWGLLHMAGGGILLADGSRLYELMLVSLSSTLPIFRYDQLIHIVGFAVATLVFYHIMKPHIKSKKIGVALGIILVLTGVGAGTLNEIIEFGAVLVAPVTGVGDYINTSLDSISNMIGAIIAVILIKIKEIK